MLENTDQKNSEYGYYSRSAKYSPISGLFLDLQPFVMIFRLKLLSHQNLTLHQQSSVMTNSSLYSYYLNIKFSWQILHVLKSIKIFMVSGTVVTFYNDYFIFYLPQRLNYTLTHHLQISDHGSYRHLDDIRTYFC